jgi:2-aminomuconate deaminase
MSENVINSSKAPEPVGLYPHARRVGNLYFVGRRTERKRREENPGVELDKNGNIISYDIEAQCRSVFSERALYLEESGSSGRNVDVTVFLTDMKNDFPAYNRIYAEYFRENLPCRTTVEINRLPTPMPLN